MTDSKPDSLPWQKKLLYGLTNFGLFVAGISNLGVGTYAALTGSATVAATSLTAGLVLLFAATIDRFESLKGLGIEAKTRQLDRKIEEADDAMRRLRELAGLSGASLISITSKLGRWDSVPSPRETYDLAQNVKSVLTSLGFETAAIRSALAPWVQAMSLDVAAAILAPLESLVLTKIGELDSRRMLLAAGNPNDAELQQVTSAHAALVAYRESRLLAIFRSAGENASGRLLALFDSVPVLTQEEIEPTQAKARKIAPEMDELSRDLKLSDPESWFKAIEDHRKH